jgi:predicted membrane channel-forming protein YqfA (hemolysin III family)
MKKLVKIIAGLAGALPFVALAQTANTTYLSSLITGAKTLLDQLVIFLIALAVVWFIWNVIRYTMSADEEKKAVAKSQMIWGIVAIAVIVSVWGLVAILQSVFGVNTTGAGNVNNLLPK